MKSWFKPLVGLLVFAMAWQVVVWSALVPEEYLPGVGAVLDALAHQLLSVRFWVSEVHTFWRTLLGLCLAAALGTGLAVLAARYRGVEQALRPLVNIIRSLPPVALVPLSIFALGLGFKLFLFIVCFAGIGTMYVSANNALRTVESVQVHSGLMMGYSHWEILWRIRVPAALPEMLTGVRLTVSDCLMATIAAEMLAGTSGLGFMLLDKAFSLRTADMFGLLFVVGLNGLLINQLVLWLRHGLVGWHDALGKMVQV